MSTVASPAQRSGFGRFWRAVRQLFHELTGAIFALFAFSWLSAVFRSWTRDAAHWLLIAGLFVAAMFVFFSVTSFRRARKV